jgi:hypothetical protein
VLFYDSNRLLAAPQLAQTNCTILEVVVHQETGKAGNLDRTHVASQECQESYMLQICEQIYLQRLGRQDGDLGDVLLKGHKMIYSRASISTQ